MECTLGIICYKTILILIRIYFEEKIFTVCLRHQSGLQCLPLNSKAPSHSLKPNSPEEKKEKWQFTSFRFLPFHFPRTKFYYGHPFCSIHLKRSPFTFLPFALCNSFLNIFSVFLSLSHSYVFELINSLLQNLVQPISGQWDLMAYSTICRL